ncbi:MAG: hypothetical protein HPY81_11445 [Firmicutes bacterium]|nr:hypothetical protein [Bacillota bacterium]
MRKIKVIAGPTLEAVQELIREWLEEGHEVKHLQIDLMLQQPPCERWQAIIIYLPNPRAKKLPKRECRRCTSKEQCSRYQTAVKKWAETVSVKPD